MEEVMGVEHSRKSKPNRAGAIPTRRLESLAGVILFLWVVVWPVNAQYANYESYNITFEDESEYGRIHIENADRPEALWQIGAPQKGNLNDAYSGSNVIITDLENPYPAGDTSSFCILHKAELALASDHEMILDGYYKVDADSLHDYGSMEMSLDKGESWINMQHGYPDSILSWQTEKPVLTGLSDWTHFLVLVGNFGTLIAYGDTVYFRFSFVSDETPDSRGGLMFDDLGVYDTWEGISTKNDSEFATKAYPSPASTDLYLRSETHRMMEGRIDIVDILGKKVLQVREVFGEEARIDVSGLPPGMYYYLLTTQESGMYSTGKFMKE
ncbi:MAG: T9SS type A sorting domain-containing protein [Bacteroidales bacterium]